MVKHARQRGIALFVDTDGVVKYYPTSVMTKRLLQLLTRHYHQVKAFLITDAVTQE